MNAERIGRIRACLDEALAPASLDVVDESHLHVGHAGARDGRGHFRVHIVSSRFRRQSMLQRHRMVYDALHGMMSSDIHALSIDARAPEESSRPG
ncbi:MAG: BolA family transcriptional regulator [Gammaproteobacteria bacterium]|nr:BolA family transcriptional regulator [Gammaproteobacteria bacterium]